MYISSAQARRQYQAPLATIKMAFTLGSLFLLCGISGLLTGVRSATIVPAKAFYCPNDWTQLDCFCYIYEDESRTFADAESVCNILGGNLVSIHGDLENAVVVELVQPRGGTLPLAIWIGLTDAVLEDDFMWTDGSDVDFDNFLGSEPSSMGDCVVMAINVNTGDWGVQNCTTPFPYVCIKEAHH
ncbi:lithostathine-1-alpha-like isoform X2 [Syngnathus typhle]|uniref:lithostathine-1-alpha-like isoform X2 n=1 Tax=Syngnathus typhle TaxID=161592 RepID=UPI002A6B5CC2|nr:lithostathine-1-alpha-like isoform X2 [Syngnathus typhle]